MGQSSAFSLESLDLHRSVLIRKARDNIINHLNLAHIPRPRVQRILVPMKSLGFQGYPNISNLCELVYESAARISQLRYFDIEVVCSLPVNQTVSEQVNDSRRATVIVAEHGTVSYASLYTHDGAVLVSIGSRDILKEPQVLLFTAIFQTFYMVYEEISDLDRYVIMALDIAARNFGIENP